jgi:thymidylate kinase
VSPGAAPPAHRGLTVELVGVPGAGKSRLTRSLAGSLAERGVPVTQAQAPLGPAVPVAVRLARKAAAGAATALSAPRTTARLAGAVLRSGQPGPADVAGRLVQVLVAAQVTARSRRREGVSLLDEGVVQALWSVGLRGDVTPVLAALDGARPSADLLVVVRVAPEVALARLAARPSQHSRTQLLAAGERLAELEHGARLLDRLVDWWSAAVPADRRPVVVEGSDAGAADRAALVDRVCATLATRR